jgi:hypothetical protein
MRRSGAIFAAAAILASSGVAAHLRFPKSKGERTVVLDLSGASAQLQYRIGFGTAMADAERKRADRDGDVVVGALESNAAMDEKTAALLRSVSICTGNQRDALTCRRLDKRDMMRMESEGWVPGPTRHLHITWTFDLRVAPTSIGAVIVEDDAQVPGLEITDVTIKAPIHAALTEAGDADKPGGITTQFTWIESARARGPRRIVAVWPVAPASSRVGLFVGIAAAAIAAALWFWPRRSKGP